MHVYLSVVQTNTLRAAPPFDCLAVVFTGGLLELSNRGIERLTVLRCSQQYGAERRRWQALPLPKYQRLAIFNCYQQSLTSARLLKEWYWNYRRIYWLHRVPGRLLTRLLFAPQQSRLSRKPPPQN